MKAISYTKNDLEMFAMCAPEYQKDVRTPEMVTTLANRYCEAVDLQDEDNKNIYMSALILKFWDQVKGICEATKTAGTTEEDAIYYLEECLCEACSARAWQKNEKLNAQQAIHQVISTRGKAAIMYRSNLKKNKDKVNLVSLDEVIDDDRATTILDTLADTHALQADRNVSEVIQECIYDNHIVEAIIMDHMAHNDCLHPDTGKPWDYKLVKLLNNLDPAYLNYFVNKYSIASDKLQVAYDAVCKADNQKKYKYIQATRVYGEQFRGSIRA